MTDIFNPTLEISADTPARCLSVSPLGEVDWQVKEKRIAYGPCTQIEGYVARKRVSQPGLGDQESLSGRGRPLPPCELQHLRSGKGLSHKVGVFLHVKLPVRNALGRISSYRNSSHEMSELDILIANVVWTTLGDLVLTDMRK